MSASALKKDSKPTFGPPVSPEIFALKWTCKFDELHLIGEALSSSDGRLSMDGFNNWLTRKVEYAGKLLAAVLGAQYEAESVGLEIKSLAQIWGNLDGAKLWLKGITEQFKRAKNGKLLYGFAQWQEVPLSLRRRINDFLAAMDDIKADGNGALIADRETLRQGLEKAGASTVIIERMERLNSG